ncbi:hypothetical protein K9N50_01145 [bacterium]|nr:hypothetical protein [bacterium]
MPNTPVWGNEGPSQNNDQDIISVEESGSVIKINDINAGAASGDDKIALHTKNSSTDTEARAFRAEGKSDFLGIVGVFGNLIVEDDVDVSNKGCVKINDVNDGNDDKIALHTKNSSTDADARALMVEGKTEITGDTAITGDVSVDGEINSGGTEVAPEDLKIGTGVGTDEVIIAGENKLTTTQGALKIGRDIAGLHGRSKIDSYTPEGHGWTGHLKIGTEETTDNVIISRSAENIRTHIISDLVVGDSEGEGDGKIDGEEDLYIGTLRTDDVIISKANQTTKVQGALHVNQNADFDGTLQVDGVTDLDNTVNLNDNTIYLDSNQLFGIVYNPVGQNPGFPSLDFIINGVVTAYVDSQGPH